MLSVYVARPQGLIRSELKPGEPLPRDALWIDLVEPTIAEEKLVEQSLSIDVPTREEMREIESSNRLYEEDGVLYMTMTIVTKLDTDLPESTQVTFILTPSTLVTNRYVDPLPFRRFKTYAEKHPAVCSSPAMLLAGILESIVNRIADVIERVQVNLDGMSTEIFSATDNRRGISRDFRALLAQVGMNGELTSKARESLVSLSRLLVFAQQTNGQLSQDVRSRFRTLSRDVVAMSDHASYLGDKVSFTLDATLGMVSIEQNNILKIFSVVTVFLLPPSVIAGFYGMNFSHLPGAQDHWGWIVALSIMVLSSVVPYLIFKRRGWL